MKKALLFAAISCITSSTLLPQTEFPNDEHIILEQKHSDQTNEDDRLKNIEDKFNILEDELASIKYSTQQIDYGIRVLILYYIFHLTVWNKN